jgi:hypothetical protein
MMQVKQRKYERGEDKSITRVCSTRLSSETGTPPMPARYTPSAKFGTARAMGQKGERLCSNKKLLMCCQTLGMRVLWAFFNSIARSNFPPVGYADQVGPANQRSSSYYRVAKYGGWNNSTDIFEWPDKFSLPITLKDHLHHGRFGMALPSSVLYDIC